MRFGDCFCAVSALALVYPALAQEAAPGEASSPDAPATQEEAAAPPPPINIVPSVPENPEAGDATAVDTPPPAPPALLIPPPAPPAPSQLSLSRLDRTPPINMKGPYPENQLPVTQLIGTEKKLKWRQMPAVFLPGLTEAGRERVLENDALVKIPLHWAMSAYLQGDVTIEGIGDPVVLKAGDVMPQVVLEEGRGVDDRFTLFCTRSRILQKQNDLLLSIFDGARDAQWCLQDSDSDGQFDLAVALAAGAPVKKAADITPVPYEMRYGQRIPGDDDFVSFRMTRVSKKHVDIGLSIFQSGKPMAFQTMTSGMYRASSTTRIRYRDVDTATTRILGVDFEVHFADRKANQAEVEWGPAPFNSSAIIPIPTKLTTTIRYY